MNGNEETSTQPSAGVIKRKKYSFNPSIREMFNNFKLMFIKTHSNISPRDIVTKGAVTVTRTEYDTGRIAFGLLVIIIGFIMFYINIEWYIVLVLLVVGLLMLATSYTKKTETLDVSGRELVFICHHGKELVTFNDAYIFTSNEYLRYPKDVFLKDKAKGGPKRIDSYFAVHCERCLILYHPSVHEPLSNLTPEEKTLFRDELNKRYLNSMSFNKPYDKPLGSELERIVRKIRKAK